jgi:4-amino-4-deoxy-L-arabinose transferase-like glycosyltransferase
MTVALSRERRTMHKHIAILLIVGASLFLPFLGARELASSHEARAAINATVVLERGCWGLPRLFDEQIELQKPPLYYWLVSVLGLVLGDVDTWAVRLPAALSGLGCMVLVYWLVARASTRRLTPLGSPVAGVLAALILGSMVHFTWLAQVGRVDMPLTLTTAMALGCLHLGDRTWRWQLTAYVALGLGVLFKGPIALVLVGLVSMAVALVDRKVAPSEPIAPILSWRWGWLIVALVAGPWFVWAHWQTGGRHFEVFFLHHNLERGFGSETLSAHPWWFYLARFWIDLAPWSLAVPVVVAWAWRKRLLHDDAVCRFGLIWFVTMLAFLSCMRFKRADYLLPAYPGLALFLGAAGHAWWQQQAARRRGTLAWSFAALLTVYIAGWTSYHLARGPAWEYRDAAQRIRRHTGPEAPVIFFRTELHPLAFHLGRPMTTVLEWENLAIWAREPRPIYFVMPAACAGAAPEHLSALALETVMVLHRLGKHHGNEALVVLCNEPAALACGLADSRPRRSAKPQAAAR